MSSQPFARNPSPPRLGLVGGLGPESTIDYYRRILSLWKERQPGSAPSIVIDSLDVDHALGLVQRDRDALVDYLAASVQRLAAAGAGCIAMTANTAHVVYDEVVARTGIPMVSIVETCATAAAASGSLRPLLLGTRFTMEGPFYRTVFARRGITVVVPAEVDRVRLHTRYVNEFLRGVFLDDARSELIALIERMRMEAAIDSVILGGTELPLLLGDTKAVALPIFDTTALHVTALVEALG